jgi:hypothetical protein
MKEKEIGNGCAIGYWAEDYLGRLNYFILFGKETRRTLVFGGIKLKSAKIINEERTEVVQEYAICGVGSRLIISGAFDFDYRQFFASLGETHREMEKQELKQIDGHYQGAKTTAWINYNTDYSFKVAVNQREGTTIHPRKIAVVLDKVNDPRQVAALSPMVQAIKREEWLGYGQKINWEAFSPDMVVPDLFPMTYIGQVSKFCPELAAQLIS